jgi:hypothetical protein
MINQKYCPFCKSPATTGCAHLALAVEGRDFVRRCVELCQGEKQWRALCEWRRRQRLATGEWSPEREDYTWLETAFCEEFLKRLSWFGGMEYEWRAGPKSKQAGFWVLLWSKDPRQLWWELRDEIERQAHEKWPERAGTPKAEIRGSKSSVHGSKSATRNGASLRF